MVPRARGRALSSSVRIGSQVQVHYNATVGHDSVLNDRVTVYPGANVSGSVTLEENVTVGSNAVVLQGLTVGRGTFIGAGAVVTRSLGPGLVVAGVPARQLDQPMAEPGWVPLGGCHGQLVLASDSITALEIIALPSRH